jgi:thiamine-phosphate pyrophosphorylase
MPVKLHGLYAITPEGPGIIDKVRAALEGGVSLLQYRRKAAPSASEARALAQLSRSYGVPFIVNDDLALALEVGADGLHLGHEDGDLAAARKALPGKLLGASCYDRLELARAAADAGADYVAFGSVFASPTKPAAVQAQLSVLGAARGLGVAVCAIGGITLSNAPQALAAGADLLAVISDLFDAPDIRQRASQYKRLFS